MAWHVDDWEPDGLNRAKRVWDADSGGWFVQFRDNNGAWTTIWKPDITIWANAIGHGIVQAQQAAVPVSIGLDMTKARHSKQPIPN